ncbi:unnamed protein product [Soboliphyme baturini]|uniref:Uncharacterized protein n=1 Tax=Soboliphyme baturini TaxID=241478 RepID=A0A183IQS2_9BILA|nr:unnamed protein product [Soboliphyme baturini]
MSLARLRAIWSTLADRAGRTSGQSPLSRTGRYAGFWQVAKRNLAPDFLLSYKDTSSVGDRGFALPTRKFVVFILGSSEGGNRWSWDKQI